MNILDYVTHEDIFLALVHLLVVLVIILLKSLIIM